VQELVRVSSKKDLCYIIKICYMSLVKVVKAYDLLITGVNE